MMVCKVCVRKILEAKFFVWKRLRGEQIQRRTYQTSKASYKMEIE